ncbi:MAG: PQQ-binding-like beta-propeller repeat protein [Prolixibacteraceae bacterium]|jgi:outer membrane protein assembly factor BamB|nr:PQQ-binding-like beta-propeller repeat protein [Prolixibacteraceae bacterium]MBT6763413.1 PQQ-binding-like beta-propeller repeat protein [Prolixibacteraceae bacterium]MBT6999029.1 PQQ-binding-like beta-propeller repeat protein [Prolixibacteraceae bacterium]MBT7394472.1 PQQ-binding-like beta-propeller repeat protein [Prolixibacteraceae bacterium]
MNNTEKLKLSENIAVIAGIFSITVALLLLLNFWQVSKSDPIESKALIALVDRLKQEPNNEELKVEIRNFDLLARKAYFNSQWQVKTGAYLLLFGAIILAFALRVYYSLKAKIEQPDIVLENEIASRILAQKGIIIVGAVVLALAFGASFATVNHLNYYNVESETAGSGEKSVDESIQVIEVGEVPKQVGGSTEQNLTSETSGPVQPEIVFVENSVENEAETVVKSEVPKLATTGGITLADVQKNHNSFRGPLGQGVVAHKNIPSEWDGATGTNILWKSPIPKHGYNSPVIWGNKVFIAGADDSSREVYCYNRADGKLLWTGVADNISGSPAKPPKVTEDTGLSAPSLTTDGKRVFAIFGTGDVIAFDMNGKRVWAKYLGVPDNHYGHSSSLITWANKLLIQYDTNRGGKAVALDAATGEVVWETVRKSKVSWASPVLAEIDGKYQLILTADPIVAGYDVETGEELWSTDCMMGEVGPSVGYSDGVVYAGNEYAILVALNPKDGSIIWENDEYLPEASSPLAHDGLLIIATSYGVLVCYDAKTGEQFWEHDVGTTLYSSPMIADGKLFMMDNDGMMRVYEFSKEMKLISENDLGEIAGTTPAFSDGRIYIRGDNNLYCIGK